MAVAFLTLLAASCTRRGPGVSGADDALPGTGRLPSRGPAEGQVFRGHAVHGHEVRAFRPCGSEQTLWAMDRSRLLWSLHGELLAHAGSYGELFAVLKGTRGAAPDAGLGSDYAGTLRVDEVLYAGLEGPDCETEWDRFRYRAAGNEPFWSAVLSAGGLRVTRPGEEDLAWPEFREERVAAGLRVEAGGGPDGVPVSLEITAAPCRDTMSGAYFAYEARLRLGSRQLAGCALTGAEPAPP
jgi:uncharacterized membrane protein